MKRKILIYVSTAPGFSLMQKMELTRELEGILNRHLTARPDDFGPLIDVVQPEDTVVFKVTC